MRGDRGCFRAVGWVGDCGMRRGGAPRGDSGVGGRKGGLAAGAAEGDATEQRAILAKVFVAAAPRVLLVGEPVDIGAGFELMVAEPFEGRQEDINDPLVAPAVAGRVEEVVPLASLGRQDVE